MSRRKFEMLKISTWNNNKKNIDFAKNGNNFLGPKVQSSDVQSPSLQSSRVQVTRRSQSKRLVVQSPAFPLCHWGISLVQRSRLHMSKVQASSHPEYEPPVAQSTVVQSPSIQSFKVQEPSRQECKHAKSKHPDRASRLQLFQYATREYAFPCK